MRYWEWDMYGPYAKQVQNQLYYFSIPFAIFLVSLAGFSMDPIVCRFLSEGPVWYWMLS